MPLKRRSDIRVETAGTPERAAAPGAERFILSPGANRTCSRLLSLTVIYRWERPAAAATEPTAVKEKEKVRVGVTEATAAWAAI
ncbi:MAG: hypothetical protein BWY71_02241 [Planctomycetes bacterium ADurb.Bin412]|nr:MAG: hypothetical protein BWY71_02241 [Planctomycetes bacterium ADurb.Bin412]